MGTVVSGCCPRVCISPKARGERALLAQRPRCEQQDAGLHWLWDREQATSRFPIPLSAQQDREGARVLHVPSARRVHEGVTLHPTAHHPHSLWSLGQWAELPSLPSHLPRLSHYLEGSWFSPTSSKSLHDIQILGSMKNEICQPFQGCGERGTLLFTLLVGMLVGM